MGHRKPYRGRRHTHHAQGGGPRRKHEVIEGVVHISARGRAIVKTAMGSFDVAHGGLHEAMDGDEVRVALVHRGGTERKAVVRDVLTRSVSSIVGTYSVADPLGVVTPLDVRQKHDFFVPPSDHSVTKFGVHAGDVVRARIVEYPKRHSSGIVTIEARLGSAAELDLAIESIIASFGLATTFSPAALEEAGGLRADVAAVLAVEPARHDLRNCCVVTVDPTDARDFDDAVSAKRLPGDSGGFELGVHIADVSHYVKLGSAIDLEARWRTCSVYLADRVLPMLPERLCTDVCSLVPDKDRLTMSVIVSLDAQGIPTGVEAFPSAIRSVARLDYDTLDHLLEGKVEPADLVCDALWQEQVANSLHVLDEIAVLRRERRRERGSVDFDTREAKVILDEKGHPSGVSVRVRTRATSMIEEAMLLANEAVARMLDEADIAAPFRCHEHPAPADLKATLPVLRELGLVVPDREDALVAGSPYALQDVLRAAQGTSAEPLATALLLRAQKKALYLPHNEGHYALGAPAYCHFTSPIRRYPDLVVHRILKILLARRMSSRVLRDTQRQLPQVCHDCSEHERVADAAERASQEAKMAELYAGRIGELAWGVIVGCERFGLFVELEESCAEGLLPVRALGQEYFIYDDVRMSLTGEATGHVWRVGQRVRIRVVRVNPSLGAIDFELAQ